MVHILREKELLDFKLKKFTKALRKHMHSREYLQFRVRNALFGRRSVTSLLPVLIYGVYVLVISQA